MVQRNVKNFSNKASQSLYHLLQMVQALAKFFRGFQPWRGQDLANADEQKVFTMNEIISRIHFFQLANEHLHDFHNRRLNIFCKVLAEGEESPGQTSGAITGQHSRLLPPSPSGFLFCNSY